MSEEFIINLNPSDIVKWCRERKHSLGLSNAKLAELSKVPIGTIDRIMAGKYTEYKYSSIQPIVSTLLGHQEETPVPINNSEQAKYYYETIEGYKLVVDNKNHEIEELKHALEILSKEKEFLVKENANKEKHLNFLEEMLNSKKN